MSMRAALRKAGVGKFLLNYVFTPAQKIGEMRYPDRDVAIQIGSHKLNVFSPRKNRIGRALYVNRIWEPEVTKALDENTKPGMVALDVGADIGYYTLNLARRVGLKGRVIAFEPIPDARQRLEENIDLNGYQNITISEYALGNQEGVVYLEDPFNKSRISLTKSNGGSKDIKVTIKRMDDLINDLGLDRIDIVKMDIEGAEHEALRGMEQSLRKYKPVLVIEVHKHYLPLFDSTTDDLRSWLSGLDYKIERIEEAGNQMSDFAETVLCRHRSGVKR